MEIITLSETEIDSRIDAAIRKSLCTVFPDGISTFAQTRAWHGSTSSWTHFIEKKGEVIAHLGVIDRTIMVGDKSIRIAGIQGVIVLPEYRGQGLSDRLLIASMDESRHRGFDLGLLFCLPILEKVYTRCGWCSLSRRNIIRIDESGNEKSLPEKNIAMEYPLHLQTFPEGDIHLQGNDW
jgi:predicted acetyltransferase